MQHDIVWEQGEATRRRLEPQIAAAAGTGADLIAVSEMFANGFSMNTAVVAEPMEGPSLEFLVGQAGRHGVILVGSISTNHPDHPLPINRLVVVDGNGLVAEYAKIHPFSFSGEDQHYSAGNSFLTLDLHGVRCTFFVCYDLRFADEFWVNAAATDLYVIVANWPGGRRLHWQTLLRARAIENQAYVLGVNRVGLDGNDGDEQRLLYTGDSMLIDPLGELLATAAGSETVIVGDVDPAIVTEVRTRFPFQADRR
ncbi:MAG: nitrilase-related carbon-nitrogen hydrolase [Acidimicrobiales bacterium]